MKSFISLIALTVIFITGNTNKSYAAFPAASQQAAQVQQAAPAQEQASVTTMKQYKPAPAAPAMSGTETGLVLGILALVFGILAIVVSPIAAIIFAAAAIVLGLMGMHRPYRGLAIAGLVLGIVGGVIALVNLAT